MKMRLTIKTNTAEEMAEVMTFKEVEDRLKVTAKRELADFSFKIDGKVMPVVTDVHLHYNTPSNTQELQGKKPKVP